jgi:hypothetical protein
VPFWSFTYTAYTVDLYAVYYGTPASHPGRFPVLAAKAFFVSSIAKVSRCVMGKDKVTSFSRFVASKTGFEHRLPDRFAVDEFSESPASRREILF